MSRRRPGLNFKIQTSWLKGAGTLPAERPDMSLDYLKGRALQYVLARHNLRETSYREFKFGIPRSVHAEISHAIVNGKREKRVKAMIVDGIEYPIPHWDFVAESPDVFA